jgi:hypothetical protein
MESFATEVRRISIINSVLVDMDPGADRLKEDTASIGAHQRRSYAEKESNLLFDNL